LTVRRVVTGHDGNGRAILVSDELIDAVCPPGREYHLIWGSDETAKFPDAGVQPRYTTFFPSVGGFRFALFTVPPDAEAPELSGLDPAVANSIYETLVPGIVRYLEEVGDGMHTTPTIDFEVVLSGSVRLELDDGAMVMLHQGDVVVQNGTRHRWTNPGKSSATLAFFAVGAHHQGVKPTERKQS
jgi:mannose-6-phosphate isomerase-like protein (cupin superfamily)